MSQAAIIFPIMFFQYIRIKYVSNYSLKFAVKSYNELLEAYLPDFIYNFVLFVMLRNYLASFVEFDKDKKKAAAKQNEE